MFCAPIGDHFPSINVNPRVKAVGQEILKFFKDCQAMSFVVVAFGIGTRSFAMIGDAAARYVPYLSLITAPFLLAHSVNDAKKRFSLMVAAAKTHKVGDTFFWMGRGVESMGYAIGDIIKPFAGGLKFAGFTQTHFGVGLTFTVIFPIILIVCGAIGGLTRGWALGRASKALHDFDKMSPDEAKEHLRWHFQDVRDLLDKAHFNENHFTNDERRQAIETLFGTDQKRAVSMVKSEMHRRVFYHALSVVVSMLVLAAGILLLFPQFRTIGYAISISSSSLLLLKILFDKNVSQEAFHRLDLLLRKEQDV